MEQNGIVIFDGECNLCSNSVNFIIKRDKASYFKFLSLQSEKAKEILEGRLSEIPDSVILVENDKIYVRSKAALLISSKLTWPWKIVSCLRIIPSIFLDPFYKLIARNRYKFWGKREECLIPSPEIKDRFLN